MPLTLQILLRLKNLITLKSIFPGAKTESDRSFRTERVIIWWLKDIHFCYDDDTGGTILFRGVIGFWGTIIPERFWIRTVSKPALFSETLLIWLLLNMHCVIMALSSWSYLELTYWDGNLIVAFFRNSPMESASYLIEGLTWCYATHPPYFI